MQGRPLKTRKALYCNTELMFQVTIIIKLTFLGFAVLNTDQNNTRCLVVSQYFKK